MAYWVIPFYIAKNTNFNLILHGGVGGGALDSPLNHVYFILNFLKNFRHAIF